MTSLNMDSDLLSNIEQKNNFKFIPPWKKYVIIIDLSLHNIRNKNATIHNERKIAYLQRIYKYYPRFRKVFTDGSKYEQSSACGFITDGNIFKFKLHNISSIFTCEALAILETLKYIDSLETNEILIITDSLSVLTALANKISSHNIIQKIQALYYELTKIKQIQFLWVPSHIRI